MCCRQHRLQSLLYLSIAGFTTHFHQLPFRPIQQEVVAHRRELRPTHFRPAMHPEEIGILPALPGTFRVSFHVFYHGVQLPFVRQLAKQRLPCVGHHRYMHDAWFAPCSRLQPRMRLVPWCIYALVCHVRWYAYALVCR